MALSLQNFSTLVQNMAAAVQSSAAALIDLTVGSPLRAILEANASIALWLQWLILQVLALTRLATSAGPDVDSWVGDFSLARLPAVAATGSVTYSRFSTAAASLVPLGALVKTLDGTRVFNVARDATNAAWNGSTGYAVAIGAASVTVPVVDVTTDALNNPSIGAAGNVAAGAIGLIASTVAMDTVTNAAPFTTGIDAESDTALRARFANYIQTRSRATPPAIGFAISQVQQGLQYTIAENTTALGAYQPGNFVVTVDDGSGAPASTLLANVSAAINLYRPIGSTWVVQAPTVTTATITLTITCSPTAAKTAALLLAVEAAVIAYVDGLPDGATLPYSRIAMAAYMADPSIVDVTGVTLQGGTADLVPGISGVIKATLASVTVA